MASIRQVLGSAAGFAILAAALPCPVDASQAPGAVVEWAIEGSPEPPPGGSVSSEIAAIHSDPLRQKAELKAAFTKTEVWVRRLSGGAVAVAAFNKDDRAAQVDVIWKELGIAGQPKVRDVLNGEDLGKVHGGFAVKLPAGGAALYRVEPGKTRR